MWTWNCDSNFPDRNLPFVSDMVSAVPLCRKSISGYKFIHVKWMVTIMDSYNTGVFNVWAFISVKIFPLAPWWLNFPYCSLLGKWIVSKEEQNKIYSGTNVTSFPFTDQPAQCCHGIVTLLPGDKSFSLWSSISVYHILLPLLAFVFTQPRNMVFSCPHILFCKLLEIFRYVLGDKWQMSYKSCFEKVL